jgi:hypothetical protein
MLGPRLIGFAQGCSLEGNDTSGIAAAVALAKKADVAVVIVGLTPNNDPTNAGTCADGCVCRRLCVLTAIYASADIGTSSVLMLY